jgi:hypothetical protein
MKNFHQAKTGAACRPVALLVAALVLAFDHVRAVAAIAWLRLEGSSWNARWRMAWASARSHLARRQARVNGSRHSSPARR